MKHRDVTSYVFLPKVSYFRSIGSIFTVWKCMKMSATMVDQRRKISKLYWIKCHKTVTQKKKFGAENNWLKTSYLQFIAINFRFSGRKSQSQQQLVEKTTHFTIQSRSKKPHSFYKPQRTEHYKKSTLATKSKTCFWLVSEKKHLYCIISRRPTTALWKQLESKCQYIPINVL